MHAGVLRVMYCCITCSKKWLVVYISVHVHRHITWLQSRHHDFDACANYAQVMIVMVRASHSGLMCCKFTLWGQAVCGALVAHVSSAALMAACAGAGVR